MKADLTNNSESLVLKRKFLTCNISREMTKRQFLESSVLIIHKCLMPKAENLLLVATMRRRVLMIVFLPVFVFLFIVGWILYVAGDKRMSKEAPERKTDESIKEEPTEDDGVEMGLIEKTVKEQPAN
jgi:hypothetical protein